MGLISMPSAEEETKDFGSLPRSCLAAKLHHRGSNVDEEDDLLTLAKTIFCCSPQARDAMIQTKWKALLLTISCLQFTLYILRNDSILAPNSNLPKEQRPFLNGEG